MFRVGIVVLCLSLVVGLLSPVGAGADVGEATAQPPAGGVGEFEYHGDGVTLHKFVVSPAGDETAVVAESEWTTASSWSPPTESLEVGESYEWRVVGFAGHQDGEQWAPEIAADGTWERVIGGKTPDAAVQETLSGPHGFVASDPAARGGAVQAGAGPNGLWARFWPVYDPKSLTQDQLDKLAPWQRPRAGTRPMDPPHSSVDLATGESDKRSYWNVHSSQLIDTPGPYDGPSDRHWLDSAKRTGADVLNAFAWFTSVTFGEAFNVFGFTLCKWFYEWPGGLFGANTKNKCADEFNRPRHVTVDLEAMASYHSDGRNVLYNTVGTNVVAAASAPLAAAGSLDGGLSYDFSETTPGVFGLTSGYAMKALGYLTVPETGEYTFGVQGAAGAQAYLDEVGESETHPGSRVHLGGTLSTGTEQASLPAHSMEIPAEAIFPTGDEKDCLEDDPEECMGEVFDRVFGDHLHGAENEINAALESVVTDTLDATVNTEISWGTPVYLEAGKPYPLTFLSWASYKGGPTGLFYASEDGPAGVPLEWVTQERRLTGFNDPVYADGDIVDVDGLDYDLSADGKTMVQLTADAVVPFTMGVDGAWVQGEPIRIEGADLGTGLGRRMSLDNRIALNEDGSVVVVTADEIGSDRAPDVVVLEKIDASGELSTDNVKVHKLSAALADAGAGGFTPQSFGPEFAEREVPDGVAGVESRNVSVSGDGQAIVVAEITNPHKAEMISADHLIHGENQLEGRVLVFAKDGADWILAADMSQQDTARTSADIVDMSTDGSYLFTANADGTVNRLDLATSEPAGNVSVGFTPVAVTAGAGVVYAFGDSGEIAAIDAHDLVVEHTYRNDDAASPTDVVATQGHLYVTTGGTVVEIDPRDMRTTRTWSFQRDRFQVDLGATILDPDVRPASASGSIELDGDSGRLLDGPLHASGTLSTSPRTVKLDVDELSFELDADGNVVDAQVSAKLSSTLHPLTTTIDLVGATGRLDEHRTLRLEFHDADGKVWADVALAPGAGPLAESLTPAAAGDLTATKPAKPSLTVDSRGYLWASVPASSEIARIDLASGRIDTRATPRPLGQITFDGDMIFGLYADTDPDAADVAARLDPDTFPVVSVEPVSLWTPALQEHDEVNIDLFSVSADPGLGIVFVGGEISYDCPPWGPCNPLPMPTLLTYDTAGRTLQPAGVGTIRTLGVDNSVNLDLSEGWVAVDTGASSGPGKISVVAGQVFYADGDSVRTWKPVLNDMYHLGLEPGVGVKPNVGRTFDALGSSSAVGRDSSGTITVALTTTTGVALYDLQAGSPPDKTGHIHMEQAQLLETHNRVALNSAGDTLVVSESNGYSQVTMYTKTVDGWEFQTSLAAPIDNTSRLATPFGGPVYLNDSFLTVTGAGQIDYKDGPPVFVFRNMNEDWSSFKEWSHLAIPDAWVYGGEKAPDPQDTVWAATVRAGGSWYDPLVTMGGRARHADYSVLVPDSSLGLAPMYGVATYTRF